MPYTPPHLIKTPTSLTKRVNRPYKKPGAKRIYQRDAGVSPKKHGMNATKKMERIRVAALRKHSPPSNNTLAQIEKLNANRPLTDKQRLFVRAWASGETPRTACAIAGFSENSTNMSWKLSRDPAIIKLYKIEKGLYEQANQMTRKRVMDMLQESYDCAKMVNEPASMVAAAREIGKMCGYYEPETRININVNGNKMLDRLQNLSDSDLIKLIEAPDDAIPGESVRVPDETTH